MNTETLHRPRTVAINYDSALRYMVPSARDPREKYLVELDAYNGAGRCCCMHYVTRCEPLIRRGISPRQAVEMGLIKLKENRFVENALRCQHIIIAREQFCDDIIAAIKERRTEDEKRAGGI